MKPCLSAIMQCVCWLVLTASPAISQGTAAFQKRQTWAFASDGVSFSNEFSGARLNGVTRTSENSYRLRITPETTPINNSPWFAFRVWSETAKTIEITLAYRGGTHRYRPQVSADGREWKPVRNVSSANRRKQATFQLEVSSRPLMIAGQPMITVEDQMKWSENLAELPFVRMSEIGRSVQNRPVPMLETRTAKADTARTLILMTGQHPPEITSVLGFRPFVETMLADTELAREFRKHFNLAIFPLMNPDGWHHGHWRCNANGVDPNRAWLGDGLATVPEVRHAIAALRKLPSPVAFFDFHSTKINVLYTGTDDDHEPRFLVPELHSALGRRVPDWLWKRESSRSSNGSPSRSWGTRELRIPTVTWEWADIAGPERLAVAPVAGAEELMRLLLRLGNDDTQPAARFDFEDPGKPGADSAGERHARVFGQPETIPEAASGKFALSLAAADTSLAAPDFDHASDGSTLSFWFRMDRDSLASGDFTYLFSHGDPTRPESLNIYHRKPSSTLRVRVRDAGDITGEGDIDLPDSLVLDGKWHHLGVVIRPGEGMRVFLNGIAHGSSPRGNDGIDPEGAIHLGIRSNATPATRFKGALDDLRLYDSPLSPYDLTTIRAARDRSVREKRETAGG